MIKETVSDIQNVKVSSYNMQNANDGIVVMVNEFVKIKVNFC